MTSTSDDQIQRIAEHLNQVPRLFSKASKRELGIGRLAQIIAEVARNPDEHTSQFHEEDTGGLRCSVCRLLKHSVYYNELQQAAPTTVRVCRYCTWRIKTVFARAFKEARGLPADPVVEQDDGARLPPAESADLHAFCEARSKATVSMDEPRLELPEEIASDVPWSWRIARDEVDWYEARDDPEYTSDREAFNSWWSATHDVVIEWFLARFGYFTTAFDLEIEAEIARLAPEGARSGRTFTEFLAHRVNKVDRLWNLLAADILERGKRSHACHACGQEQPWVEIGHNEIVSTRGIVLPLCNHHWNTLTRALFSLQPAPASLDEYMPHIVSVLGTHTCPVCSNEHSWKERTYTHTDGFYSIPPRYHQICFDCLNDAINHDAAGSSADTGMETLLEISRTINALPNESMFEVIFEQAENLDTASAVVRLMRRMPSFGTLKADAGSWFAVLARSGCLPGGILESHRGTRVLAEDGHECLSIAEFQIDNLLNEWGVRHEKEVKYPGSAYRCDWLVERGNEQLYVEYFGLAGQPEYDERIEEKRILARKEGLKLVELYPADLRRLRIVLRERLSLPQGSAN